MRNTCYRWAQLKRNTTSLVYLIWIYFDAMIGQNLFQCHDRANLFRSQEGSNRKLSDFELAICWMLRFIPRPAHGDIIYIFFFFSSLSAITSTPVPKLKAMLSFSNTTWLLEAQIIIFIFIFNLELQTKKPLHFSYFGENLPNHVKIIQQPYFMVSSKQQNRGNIQIIHLAPHYTEWLHTPAPHPFPLHPSEFCPKMFISNFVI